MIIREILEDKNIGNYIISHNLLNQYKKAKTKLLNGDFKSVNFKKRRPYKTEKYYFIINQKYRAFGYFEGDILKIFEINDHQD